MLIFELPLLDLGLLDLRQNLSLLAFLSEPSLLVNYGGVSVMLDHSLLLAEVLVLVHAALLVFLIHNRFCLVTKYFFLVVEIF